MIVQYGMAILFVAVALVLALLLVGVMDTIPLLYAAVVISSWYSGRGPGLLSVFLTTLAVDYFFVPPFQTFKLGIYLIPRLAVFLMSALLISWLSDKRKRIEGSLKQAHDEMEAKVIERTADLKQTNEKLQEEITERRRMEDALRERANLLDLTHDTVFVRDMNDVITYWNRGAEELYGWKKQEAIGQVSHKLTQTIFPAPLEEINELLLKTERWEGELTHTKRDGTQVVVASRWSLQRDNQGRPAAILETNNDITGRKGAEQELQKTQAELAHVTRVMTMVELTSSIAHEVNQPLAAIVTNGNACLRWLAAKSPNLDEARESVGRIIRDGHRASEIVGRVRALFKKTAPAKAELDINSLIQDVAALVRNEMLTNQVLMRTELAADLPSVLGDRIQLQQVLLNLIINGVDAMKPVTERPRKLLIKSQRQQPDAVLVSVEDSGMGIQTENVSQVFEAFFTTKPEGLGMGLSICRTTIEAHGGRLWATSNDREGATFHFTLPASGESLR